ncbi:hypothetical protein Fmac_015812 [Flemingia macrophylla]|uniref:Pentatricopeptide repeat-containing protein n=1 Tax=Flemingia macrophylla TaxID=520843 RepID=A0ABD1MFL6_9FABA
MAQGFRFNQLIYGTLVNGLSKTGETKVALELLKKIEGHSIKPNVVMYNTIIDNLCKNKLVADAYENEKHQPKGKMKEAKIVMAAMVKAGVKPNVVTYTILMNGYCLINEVKHAKYVFNSMVQNGIAPNVHCYTTMIDGFCKKQNDR